MKILAYVLLFVFLAESSSQSQMRPRAPGLQQANQAEQQADKSLPPPIAHQASLDFSKLRADADELARIAQTIPTDMARVQQGLLPKDMSAKLKQIEKLSKRLRREINQ